MLDADRMAGSDDPASFAPVNLLWTGGWDSSFRLLQLLLLHRRKVVPWYLVDETRASSRNELLAMQRIRERLFQEHPHTRSLLAPLRRHDVAEIAPDPEITAAHATLASERFLGNQYDWLARFCKQQGIERAELAAGYVGGRIHAALHAFVTSFRDGDHDSYRVGPEHRGTPQHLLFGAFSFPLFELDKLGTARIAADHGWLDLLDLTCFCHKPRDDGAPCGCCNPCLYAVDEGFGWRIPRRNRIKGMFYRALVRPAKAPAKAILRRLGAGTGRSPSRAG